MNSNCNSCVDIPTIDYGADHVARGFDLRGVVSPERTKRLVALIDSLVTTRPARLLDIGCGTGRFSIPLALSLKGFTVVGADNSPRMLEEAQRKPDSDKVVWTVTDVCAQTFETATFDVVFVSDLLHHIGDPVKALTECRRVLRPGGVMIVKYGAMENIVKDPEHVFFDGTVAVDAARTPTEEAVKHWLSQSGFVNVLSKTENERTRTCGSHRLSAAQAKSISVLHMIDDRQFEEGLRRLHAHVTANPNDPWLLVDPTTFTWGRKPA
jgi:ubiquinone/menaquinone biosynthesis C-methylase UbiE